MTTRIGAAINRITVTANAIIESSFPDKCAIKRPPGKSTVSTYGSIQSGADSTIHSSIGCSWGPLSASAAQEYIRAGQITEAATYLITIASAISGTATDIKPKDRIVVATRGTEPARTFEVKGIVRNAGLPLTVLCTLEDS